MTRLYRKRRILHSLGATTIAVGLGACEAPPPEPKPPASNVYRESLQQARDATDAVNTNSSNKQQQIDELLGRD